MTKKVSDRYKKALVTVAMGFRTEEDIKKNGLYRFTKSEKASLINFVTSLFKKNKSVLSLKVSKNGYRSEHINIDSKEKLNEFKENIDNLFSDDNEIWVVCSSVIECWRCRIYLSNDNENDRIEMAYSYDDHILDHINLNDDVPYIYYKIKNNNFLVSDTNLSEEKRQETLLIIKDIFKKYSVNFKNIKNDLEFIGINGISLDVRINNGYDFHDFDVSYEDIAKVVDYYLPY